MGIPSFHKQLRAWGVVLNVNGNGRSSVALEQDQDQEEVEEEEEDNAGAPTWTEALSAYHETRTGRREAVCVVMDATALASKQVQAQHAGGRAEAEGGAFCEKRGRRNVFQPLWGGGGPWFGAWH